MRSLAACWLPQVPWTPTLRLKLLLIPAGPQSYACPLPRDPRQRWQLAAGCLRHCAIVLDALPPALAPETLLARPPPGAAVLESALTGGVVFQGIMHMLQPGEEDLVVGFLCIPLFGTAFGPDVKAPTC